MLYDADQLPHDKLFTRQPSLIPRQDIYISKSMLSAIKMRVKLVINQAQNGGSLGEERMRPGTEMLADNQSSTPDACRPAENISHVSRAQSLHTATSIPPASTSRRPQATRSHTVSTGSLVTNRTVVTTDSPLTDRTAATTDSTVTGRNVVTTDSTVTDRNSVTTNSAISTVSVPSAMTDKHTVTSTKSVTNRRTVTTDSETTDIKGIATNQRVSTTRRLLLVVRLFLI
ncbi:hypothetical protein EB796_016523 [Bugula neritina]|uniref:Uncharacterized protein n=1 Tax=Bugula neritina TaxID=10212 RepID=A0A7J7JI01_BUGNE|nr:hypothetical protein EB796_016523 [Bugula neritina]